MAVRVGTGGAIAIPDTSGASVVAMTISKWSADFPRETADITGFTPTSNLRVPAGGNMGISGTFEGFLDATLVFDETDFAADSPATAVTITLDYNRVTPTGVDRFQRVSFSGHLTKFGASVAVSAPNAVRGAFVGTGAAAWAKAGV